MSGRPRARTPTLIAASTTRPIAQGAGTPSIWNPLPSFTDVKADGQLGNVQDLSHFYPAVADGTLPAVSWVTPSQPNSDHPPANLDAGQAYVTNLINAIMRGPAADFDFSQSPRPPVLLSTSPPPGPASTIP